MLSLGHFEITNVRKRNIIWGHDAIREKFTAEVTRRGNKWLSEE